MPDAASGLLLERAHLLLPLAAQLGPSSPDFASAIRGSSMAPAIPAGARIRVRIGGSSDCQLGDVVFYLADDGYTVHRIVHRMRRTSGADYLLTEGDARFAPDAPVACSQVLGTVVAVECDGVWCPLAAQTPGPWHRRAVRAVTLPVMVVAMSVSTVLARRLAGVLLGCESRARLERRRMVRLLARTRARLAAAFRA